MDRFLLEEVAALLGFVHAAALPALAWVVVGRRPVPGWVVLAVPALLAAVLAHPALPLHSPMWEVGAVLGAPVAVGAVLGALIRPGAPTAPMPARRAAPFVLGTIPLLALPLLGQSSLLVAWIWLLTAGAVGLAVRGGHTARASSGPVSMLAVLLSAVGLLLRPEDRVLFGLALLHAGVVRWSLAPRATADRWSLVVGLGVPAAFLALMQVPALQTELATRWRGAWSTIPIYRGDPGRWRAVQPLDCWPLAPVPGGRYRGCPDEPVRLVSPDTPVGGVVDPIVVRTGATWPPGERVMVLDLFRPPRERQAPLRLVGGDQVTLPDGRPATLREALWSIGRGSVVDPAGATWRELLELCADGGCSFPASFEPSAPADGAAPWVHLVRTAADLLLFGGLLGWTRRLTRDHGRVPSGLWPVVGLVVAVPTVFVGANPLLVLGAVSAGQALGAERYGPGRARDRWLGVLVLLPVAIAGCAVPDLRGLAPWLAACAAGPALLAGRPSLVRLRGELAAAFGALGALVALAGSDWHLLARSPRSLGLAWLLAVQLCLIGIPAATECWRAGRRGLAGLVATLVAGCLALAGVLLAPNPIHLRLAALDAAAPVTRAPGRAYVPGETCAWTPAGVVDLWTGAACARAKVAVVPGEWPAERVTALPASAYLLVVRHPAILPALGWSAVWFTAFEPWDDPEGAVLPEAGWTVSQLVAACEQRNTCALVRPGVAGVPWPP